jgi:methylthioribose-1-phosphate isomerase
VTVVVEGAAAHLMKQGGVRWVIVGADRIAANGDTANKIGTYSHALAARYHGLKFMVVAPTSTIDPATATGAEIPIEERSGAEFYSFAGSVMTPKDTSIYSPVFDVTPAQLVDVLVTEKGAIHAPDREKIAAILG